MWSYAAGLCRCCWRWRRFSVQATAQLPAAADDRFAGLQRWRFVRIKYHYSTEGTRQSQDFYGEQWLIDGPAAEQNLSRRIKTATSIDVLDPIVPTPPDDPRLFQNPWIYFFVEPGNLKTDRQRREDPARFSCAAVSALFDDFHGPYGGSTSKTR